MIRHNLSLMPIACLVLAWPSVASAQKPFTQTIPDTSVSFHMLPVPAGEIKLPDPKNPDAQVTVKIKPFYIGKTEVTWDEYDLFYIYKRDGSEGEIDAESRPSRPYGTPDRGYGHEGYPVISISAHAAAKYCEWLSQKTGRKYRLPTEAEWQYACLAGQPAPEGDTLKEIAWFWEESTHPAGKKKPNAWGIHDMLGNVGEWALDLQGKPVLCGGSFQDTARRVTPTARVYQTPEWQATDPQNPKGKWWLSDAPFAGFRVVCEQ